MQYCISMISLSNSVILLSYLSALLSFLSFFYITLPLSAPQKRGFGGLCFKTHSLVISPLFHSSSSIDTSMIFHPYLTFSSNIYLFYLSYLSNSFHGTSASNISSIISNGFRVPGQNGHQHSTDEGWYGKGK